jgi:ubiquitin-protein ligase
MTDRIAIRLSRELKKLAEQPVPGVMIAPVGNDLFNLEGTVIGPEESPYAGGIFKIKIVIPPTYPFTPPAFLIITPIYHPAVEIHQDPKYGVCLENFTGKG